MNQNKAKISLNKAAMVDYLLVLAVVVLYTVFLDIKFGVLFLVPVLLLPFLSFFMVRGALNHPDFSVALSNDALDKGETLEFTAEIQITTRIPVPFLSVRFYHEGNLTALGKETELFSVSAKRKFKTTKQFRAAIWGTARVGIQQVKAGDFLGLFFVEIDPDLLTSLYSRSVTIYPDIGISRQNNLAVQMLRAMDADENGETEESVKVSFLTEPGYEHREYVPGDSLKRVNWKLSARMDKMMVREVERASTRRPIVILDRRGVLAPAGRKDGSLAGLKKEEHLIEASLAMLSSMAALGVSCGFWACFNGAWQQTDVEKEEDVVALRRDFGHYSYDTTKTRNRPEAEDESRLPAEKLRQVGSEGTVLVFSCAPNQELESLIQQLRGGLDKTYVVADDSDPAAERFRGLWTVSPDFEFQKA